MGVLERLPEGERKLYRDDVYSGPYDQYVFLKKAVDDGSKLPKYYISIFSQIGDQFREQGYLYFYLDPANKISYYVGTKVYPEYRNLNIASFLTATWIDLCLNNGYDLLGTNHKQRKPFLLYLLKTYGFEVFDRSLYHTRKDVISIVSSEDKQDLTKYLLFKDPRHEMVFRGTNIFREDNYQIVQSMDGLNLLDRVILPLQSAKKSGVDYELLDYEKAKTKTLSTLYNHKK